MYERAEFAKELGSVIIMIDLVIGYTAIQSMAKWARRNGMILHLHRAGHGTYTRQKTHGVCFRVIAKWCAWPASTTSTPARSSASSKAIPRPRAGFYDICREDFNPTQTRARHLLRPGLGRLNRSMPVASGGIHAGQMHQLLDLSRRRRGPAVRRRHHRPPDGHRRPARPPTASRWRR